MNLQPAVRWTCTILPGLLGMALLAGCGGEDVTDPQTVPVTGSVHWEGQPLEGALVTFSGKPGTAADGQTALGTTDASGSFTLTTHFGPGRESAGAVPGTYRVSISRMVPPEGMTEEQHAEMVRKADEIVSGGGVLQADQQPPSKVQLLPPKYSSMQQSELEREVTAEGENTFRFELE